MRIRRITTSLRDGTSSVDEQVEVPFEAIPPEAVGGALGFTAAMIHDDDDPARHWTVFHFPANTYLPPHATPTVDYVTIIDGELELVVPDQEPVRLVRGDCLVQGGALHAWRTTDVPATVSAVVVNLREGVQQH